MIPGRGALAEHFERQITGMFLFKAENPRTGPDLPHRCLINLRKAERRCVPAVPAVPERRLAGGAAAALGDSCT